MLMQAFLNQTRLFSVQVFYWSHLSYIWVWALLVVHCANFWKWFVVPGVVFLIEKLVGIAVSRMGGLYIVEVNLLPSKVYRSSQCTYFCCILLAGTFTSFTLTGFHVCFKGDAFGNQEASILSLQTWRLCVYKHPNCCKI